MEYRQFNLKQRPELKGQINQLTEKVWPKFMRHADTPLWPSLCEDFTEYQIMLCTRADSVIGVGQCVPFYWTEALDDLPQNLNAITERALRGQREGVSPNTLCALSAMVAPSCRGLGLGREILMGFQRLAAKKGLSSMLAPARPTLKCRYPLTEMSRYVEWKCKDGTLLDPWLRTHAVLGARPLKLIQKVMVVRGTVAQWERWTEMEFPDDGAYIVPGALAPILIDRRADSGIYEEPSIWLRHIVPASRPEGF